MAKGKGEAAKWKVEMAKSATERNGDVRPVARDRTSNRVIAECPAIPGCVSQGKTEDEAEQNIREAIQVCLEVKAEKGMPLTVSTRQVEVAV